MNLVCSIPWNFFSIINQPAFIAILDDFISLGDVHGALPKTGEGQGSDGLAGTLARQQEMSMCFYIQIWKDKSDEEVCRRRQVEHLKGASV